MKFWSGFIIKKSFHILCKCCQNKQKVPFHLSSQIFLLSANRAKFRTFHYWRISNEQLVKYPPFWLPLDIKKLLTSDSVITHQKFRSSGRHVTQISTWQGMLLASLAAEKQEVSCKTLLKLENNSLKGVWSTIQILKTNTDRNIMAGRKGLGEPRAKIREKKHFTLTQPHGYHQFPNRPLALSPPYFQMCRSLVFRKR